MDDGNRKGTTLDPVFVVSTGRCGSTLLSAMVRLNSQILSASEFFGYLGPGAVRAPVVTGETAFRRLNTPIPGFREFLENTPIDEVLYPLGKGGRYGIENLPPILCATLPHLTNHHERLWDELGPQLRARARHHLTDHYRFVLDWLRERFSRRVWVERTGGTLPMAPVLAHRFPDARFVHIYRDGRDTAISMYNHPGFRPMAIRSLVVRKMGLDPFSHLNWGGSSPWIHIVVRLLAGVVPPKRFLERDIPLESFGWFWSGMIEKGTAFLDTLAPGRVLSMRFETLLNSPREEMTRFAEFVGPGLADTKWLEVLSTLPRRKPPSWTRLPRDQQVRLARACAPGQRILGYAGQDGS
jgi:putative sulfotransferase